MVQLLDKTIDILNIKYLRGPSVWTYDPVMEIWIDIGDLENFPSDKIPGFYERLVKCMPGLIEHRCSVGERGGFFQRVREGTWAGHILEHIALELQAMAGFPGGFGRTRDGGQVGVYRVVVSNWEDAVTLAAFHHARDLLMALIQDRDGPDTDIARMVADLREKVDKVCLGPSTASIVAAAEARKIPAIRLSDGNLVQLGYGSQQRRIWAAETDQTGAIAEGISRDKYLTKSLLAAVGIPVPEGRMVDSASDAWDAAQEFGLPVVVKPLDGNHGRGVFLNLTTREEIEMAYAVAVDEGSGVMVERYILGDEHRLLVVGSRVVAAAKGEVAKVVGDGVHTVRELIELQINSDPRRGGNEDAPLNVVRIDRAVTLDLSRQGLTPDSCPVAGRWVMIQPNGNLSNDVTDQVHPEVARQVALAARIVGLDVAGIDLVTKDVSQPLEHVGAAIVEVNAGPGLLLHLKPASGTAQPVGRAIVDNLFPHDINGRIPVVGISGSRGRTVVAELLSYILGLGDRRVGLASSRGLFFGTRQVSKTSGDNWASGRRILQNPSVDVAVIENGTRTLLHEGFAYDRCQVGVVTNLDPNETHPECIVLYAEQLFDAVRTQVDVVLPSGAAVLNADDPAVADMARLCDGEVIFFSRDPSSELIQAHLDAGGRAVLVEGHFIRFQKGTGGLSTVACLTINHIDCLRDPAKAVDYAAVLGAAWALGVSPQFICVAIESLVPEAFPHLVS